VTSWPKDGRIPLDDFDYEEDLTRSKHVRNADRIAEMLAQVPVVSRKDHIREFAKEYRAGQHATALGPSGRGKTKLFGQLLVATLQRHPEIEGRILHGKIKGRDDTIADLSRRGFPITETSSLSRLDKIRWEMGKHPKRRGFIVRPLVKPMGQSDDKVDMTDRENALLTRVFKRTIYKSYHAPKKHPVILFCDEAHQMHNDLKLRKACEGPLMRGRPVCGVWSLVQRGRYVSYMVYDQAEHVYIFYDPDTDNQRRYAEIGGVDPQLLRELSQRLKTKTVADGSTISQCIYFRRSGNQLVIVDT
jgi:hypothetical protein